MSITVNIMSYRYGHLAAQAIESVLNQSHKPDVIRFFDDNAKDCAHLPEIYPEVEFVFRRKNQGIVANFNDALKRTTTDWVIFLGADNWLVPKTVELCMAHDEDIVSYDGVKFGKGDTEYWMLHDFPHGSAMYNVALAKKYMYAASGNPHTEEDNVLFTKMLKGGATLHIIREPLLMYRWRHRRNFNQ